VVELRPEDRRMLVDHCRNRLNLGDLQEGATSGALNSSDYTGSVNGVAKAVLSVLSTDEAVSLDRLIERLEALLHRRLSHRCSSWN
jgi:hypothetical protein